MPVSYQHKAIFVHVPKCAGSSVNQLILPEVAHLMGNPDKFSLRYLYGRNLQHLTAKKIRLIKPISFHRFFKFAFVRNPWARIESEYKWRCSWDKQTQLLTFEDFVLKLPEYRNIGDPHFLQASDFVLNHKGHEIVDFIGKHENIEQDMEIVLNEIGIKQQLKKVNVSPVTKEGHKGSFIYTEAMSDIVRELYDRDFKYFNYE